ncbi:MAG: hypothetical protein AAGK00_16560 [Pseudomonadota bacterium]
MLLRAGLAGDRQGMQDAATGIGFLADDTNPRHAGMVMDMIDLVFGSILSGPDFDFGTGDLSRQLNQLGARLAAEDFVPSPVPMDILFLQRKVAGTFLLANRLSARVPVRALAERFV